MEEDNGFFNLLSSCACALVFTILLLRDVKKAFKRKALWIPAEALVLSALTIQILGLIDYSHINYMANKSETQQQVGILLEADQLVVDSARLMMCVFLSYLIPQMVRSHWTSVWSDTGALVVVVMFHLGVEVYFVWNSRKQYFHDQSLWFIAYSTILFIDTAMLILLLTCAVFAGKSIRKVISHKLPSVVSCCESNCPEGRQRQCHSIEDHIFKCWIVARVTQPDYVMARSVFSALAGLLVSVSVVIFLVKWNYIQLQSEYNIIRKIIVAVEFSFVLVGWIVVLMRWFTSVMYFPKNVQVLFSMEDFWTRTIAEVKDDLDTQSKSQVYRKQRSRGRMIVHKVLVTLITRIRLHSFLLPMRIWLQKLMVYLSKACWLLSEFVLGMIRPFIMSREKIDLLSGSNISNARDSHKFFFKCSEALDIIRMPGEVAYSLWLANECAFNQTENHMKQGIEKGKSTSTAELIHLIRHKTGPVEDEPRSAALVLEEEFKHFKNLGKSSWKMTANSLLYCMINFYDGTRYKDVINEAIEACSQAWDFMDIIDHSNQEVKLVSLAADQAFYNLQDIWNKGSMKSLEQEIKKPFREGMEQLSKDMTTGESRDFSSVESQHDSKDWMREALKINLYEAWKAHEVINSVNPIDNLLRLLAKVIVHCIDNEIDNALIENCSKWAEEGLEAEIYRAAFIRGKLNGVRDQLGEGTVQAV